MKLLKFIVAIILVQVGSKLWVNPKQVAGIESLEYQGVTGIKHVPEYPTRIILAGDGNGALLYSDWDSNKIKTILEGAKE